MKQIHLLPKSLNNKIANGIWIEKIKNWCNIYITSNEEIKEGDWFYSSFQNEERILKYNKFVIPFPKDKKIILTTDQDLINNSVKAIDDECLEMLEQKIIQLENK